MGSISSGHRPGCIRHDPFCLAFTLIDIMPLISTAPLCIVDVVGRDAARVANNLCTAPLLQLAIGQGCEAFFTDVRGRTLGHFCVYALSDGLRLIGAAGQAEVLAAHFDRYTIREEAAVHDHSVTESGIMISTDLLGRCEPQVDFGTPAVSSIFAWRPLSAEAETLGLAAYQVPWLGESHVLIAGNATAVDSWLATHTAECGPGGERLGVDHFHLLRVQHRFPWFGIDLDDKNLPQEADRDSVAISFTKGCYLGQETVARLDALGQVQKKLVLWKVHSASRPPVGTQLTAGDNVVGRLTSVVHDDAPNAWLALGFARRTHFEPGSQADWSDQGTAEVV